MEKIEKVLASGNTRATVNRNPDAKRGDFGVYDLKLTAPGVESLEFVATEPHPRAEQLFAGAWSACYTTVFGMAAQLKKVTLPSDYSIDLKVNIGQTGAAWILGAEFTVRVPGVEPEVVESIAHLAHQICPYSKSVRGNIGVVTNIVTA
ncbi:peroxiredoxin [Paraburkholderia dipogonis]|uniref:Peroxiredoxin n=1 Tax=Paraburkholderia dipogonis TaxID=1211383 RepID=A0A4Y8N634_9BURK|nr:OsmC family protein [Paraburkholderia dipogonis]TFE45062.1 peroxiredoxin [Paraburkholderia dipogonis]